MGENFQKDLQRVGELHVWNKQILTFGGIWPLDESFFKFYVGATYLAIHMTLTFGDFVSVFGDLSLTIANLLEASTQIMLASKIIVLRHSNLLREVLKQVQSGVNHERYMDEEEKKLYLSYNTVGRLFFKAGTGFASATIIMLFLKPFEDIVRAVLQNETIPFVLPCRMRLYNEITDSLTYTLYYLWQCPMMYYYLLHTISSCFLGTVMVHVAGDLAILAHRIRNINSSNASINYRDPEIAFRNVVIEHNKIVSTTAAINDIFNMVLLVELLISTVLIGLTCYNILVKSVTVSMTDFFFIVNYSIIVLLLILMYCTTGEYLIRESMNVHDAYYECHWYDMRSNYGKHLIICMSRSRKPLQLTAGRFYIFSLARFTEILKTSMAYISMLRNVV